MANAQMEQALNELKLKEAKIKEDEDRLKKEKEWVANNQLRNEKKIKLNVGGTYYTTTLTTLKSDPDSMLAAMFSGRFPIEKDEDDGAYFIDRNGRTFGYILDWLRMWELPPNLSEEDLFLLKKEADYYQLSKLLATLPQSSEKDFICLKRPKQERYNDFVPYEWWFQKEVVPWLKKGYSIVHAYGPKGETKFVVLMSSHVEEPQVDLQPTPVDRHTTQSIGRSILAAVKK